MGQFTIPLKRVIKLTPKDMTRDEWLGLGEYPIYKPEHREVLNNKIVDRYFNQEIGMETIQLFQLAVSRRMNEIMPYYNKLYETTELQYDALKTIDIETTGQTTQTQDTTSNGLSSTESDNASKSRSVTSATPQNMLAGNRDYATGATDVNSSTSSDATATQSNNSNAEVEANTSSKTSGYQGVPANLIMAYRASIMNLDVQIIDDLEDCFMAIWDNGDDSESTKGY